MKKVKILIGFLLLHTITSYGQDVRVNKTRNEHSGARIHEQAVESILASNKITENSNVHYEAGKYILMLPGFQADNKSVYKANIADVAYQPQSAEFNSIMIKGTPNPFINNTEINFAFPNSVKASMVVYSELGVPVKRLFVDEQFERGSYTRTFSGENLTVGLYIVSLVDSFGNKATIKLEKR